MLESTDSFALVFGALGLGLGVVSATYSRIGDLERRRDFYSMAIAETREAMDSANRVLAAPEAPWPVRITILSLLKAHARPDFGFCYAQDFMRYAMEHQAHQEAYSKEDNPLVSGIASLKLSAPEVAQDAHRAMMGLLLSLTAIHGDRVSLLETTSEAATNPDGVFSRLGRIFRSDDNDTGFSGTQTPVAT